MPKQFIKRLPKKMTDEETLWTAGWKSIDFYHKKAIVCKAFKIYTPHLCWKFYWKRTTRTPHVINIKVIQSSFKSNHYKRSFSYRVCIAWNNISNDIFNSFKAIFDSFKYSLKKSSGNRVNIFWINFKNTLFIYQNFFTVN